MHEPTSPGVPGPRLTRRAVLSATGASVAAGLAGCLGDGDSGTGDGDGDSGTGNGDGTSTGGSNDGAGESDGAPVVWRTTELTRVRGDATFTIDALEPPVVVQSFAVWCPKCERQSKALSRLPDGYTVVSLNTDPNEDAEKVRKHAQSNGFAWRFAVAPSAMTESLIDEFGTTVTNAPSTPLVFACGDGSARFDAAGVRSADEVVSLADGC